MCCWNFATYKWKVHNGKIDILSFGINIGKMKSCLLPPYFGFNRPSLSISRYRKGYEADLAVSVISFILISLE